MHSKEVRARVEIGGFLPAQVPAAEGRRVDRSPEITTGRHSSLKLCIINGSHRWT